MSVALDSVSQTQGDGRDSIAERWQDWLDDDLKSSDALKDFSSLNDLAKNYLDISKDSGNKINIPNDVSTPEDWNKFYDTLGRPSDKKYLVNRKPEDESILSGYEELFFNSGLSKKQGEAILNRMYEVQDEGNKSQKEQFEKLKHQNLSALFGKYGQSFDQKIKIAIGAMDKYGGSDLAQLVEESNYHPAIIDMLVRVGESLQPDGIVTSDQSYNNDTPEYALKEINRLESDAEFMKRYKDKKHEEHKSAVEKMDELYKLAYRK